MEGRATKHGVLVKVGGFELVPPLWSSALAQFSFSVASALNGLTGELKNKSRVD